MADPADKSRPSSAPLSVEDADRLADSFTPFWEDPGTPVAPGLAPTPVPNPGTVTAPMPVVEAVPKPLGKQTLLGIAPLTIERPSTPAQATPLPAGVALPRALPATAPVAAPMPGPVPAATAPDQPSEQAAPAANLQKKTLLGYADATTGASVPTPIARASVALGTVQQSAPEVPGYAIAYKPKDPPSTPAVVIAPVAQSSPENLPPENKRQFSQTVPSLVRSAPNASVAPLPPPAAVDDFNPYAPKKGKGKVIGLGLVSTLLVLGAVVGVRTLSGGSREAAQQSAPHTNVAPEATAVAPAPTLAPAKPVDSAEPVPAPASSAAAEPARAVVAGRRASEPAAAKAKAKPKTEPARPVVRAPEPSPTPTKPASKSVIVRDAPF